MAEMTETDIYRQLEIMRLWDKEGIPQTEDIHAFVQDVLDRWAPLAEELEMTAEQAELENLSVKLGYPDDYYKLEKLLTESRKKCEKLFSTFAEPIKAMLDDIGIEHTFKFRMKSIYSTWRKMRVDNKRFDDVYDLFAARIIYKPLSPHAIAEGLADSIEACDSAAHVVHQTIDEIDAERMTCWRIYATISMLYRIHPGRIKNWINNPRPSGYQALHLTAMGPGGHWMEVQIRSERMDYEAEHGKAAHWKYKRETATS